MASQREGACVIAVYRAQRNRIRNHKSVFQLQVPAIQIQGLLRDVLAWDDEPVSLAEVIDWRD